VTKGAKTSKESDKRCLEAKTINHWWLRTLARRISLIQRKVSIKMHGRAFTVEKVIKNNPNTSFGYVDLNFEGRLFSDPEDIHDHFNEWCLDAF
jgi:hypothetical protein